MDQLLKQQGGGRTVLLALVIVLLGKLQIGRAQPGNSDTKATPNIALAANLPSDAGVYYPIDKVGESYLSQNSKDDKQYAHFLLTQAIQQMEEGHYDRALHHLEQAKNRFIELDHQEGLAATLYNLGVFHQKTNNFELGNDYLSQSHDIYTSLGQSNATGNILKALGEIHHELADYPKAINYFQAGINTIDSDQATHTLADFHKILGKSYYAMGDHPNALRALQQSIISHENADHGHLAEAHYYLGDIHFINGTFDSALVYLEQAYQLAQQSNNLETLHDISLRLYQLFENQDDHEQALYYHKIAKTIADSISQEKALLATTELKNKHAFEVERLQYQHLLRRDRWLGIIAIVCLVGAIIVIFFLVRSYLIKKEGLRVLEEKNSEILETRDQLLIQEKMASLGQLASGIAHEIKNPLNFVNNFAEGSIELADELMEELEKYQSSESVSFIDEIKSIANELKQNATDINQNGQRADRIVQGIMQFADSKNGNFSNANLNQLVKENVHLACRGNRINDPNLSMKITTDFDPNLGDIRVIPQDLSRVILNIIGNSFFAINEKMKLDLDGFKPKIKVATNVQEEFAEIKIWDNGLGIPEEIKHQIFTPFFTTKPSGGGNPGLGLAISYEIIVNDHQGSLEVDSELGKYSQFIIRLPLQRQLSNVA